MINYLTDTRKQKPNSLGDLIKKFEVVKTVKRTEWQIKAFDVADKLKIDFKKNRADLGKWLSLFKSAYTGGKLGKLDKCYSFVIDYSKNLTDVQKIRLFFWRYGKKDI